MSDKLIVFEGFNIEFLTKSEVNFEFNGNVIFHGGQTASVLGYSNVADALKQHIDEDCKYKVTNSNIVNHDFRKLHNTGEVFIDEDGIIDLTYKSKLPQATEFRKRVRDIIKRVQATGRYDIVENNIDQIEDERERELRKKIHTLEQLIKIDPDDRMSFMLYRDNKTLLELHLQSSKINNVAAEVKSLKESLANATVLREGDSSPEAIAKYFNIFSKNNNPHGRFAECLARELGFYIKPEGNLGYQDDYVSVNLSDRNGMTVPLLKYSKLALKEMKQYIEDSGLPVNEPPIYYSRGEKKGQFKETYIYFDHSDKVWINETTYNLYKNK